MRPTDKAAAVTVLIRRVDTAIQCSDAAAAAAAAGNLRTRLRTHERHETILRQRHANCAEA